jgi:hypothetical protein
MAAVTVDELVERSMRSVDPVDQMFVQSTTRMRAHELFDLLDQVAPDDGVIDVHALGPAPEPAPAPGHNRNVARRLGSSSERTTAMMPALAPEAFGVDEPVPRASRTWLIAALTCVACASWAVIAMS